MSFSHVFVPRIVSCAAADVGQGTDMSTDSVSLQRKDVEVEEVVLVRLIYRSHTFFMDYEKLCFRGRPAQKNCFRCFGEIQSVSDSDMPYTRVHTVQQREMREWVGGITRH